MSNLEVILTEAAIVAGAGFFLWKVAAGWLVVNLEIFIETERQPETQTEDLLAFTITFRKGNTDTLQIKDIQVRVRTEEESATPVKIFNFSEIHKLRIDKNTVNWNQYNAQGKNISLSPAESFHFGRFVTVPAGKPVIIEGVLFGTRTMWGRGFQWRASVVSLPVKKEERISIA